MSNKFHQISFKKIFSDCQDMFIDDVPSFFDLIEEHLKISSFIPDSFFSAFYRSIGRKRIYLLTSFLSALILQKNFFNTYRFNAYPFLKALRGTPRLLRIYQSSRCSVAYPLQTGFPSVY